MATAAEKLATYRRSQSGLGDLSFVRGADGKDGQNGIGIKGDKGDTGPAGARGMQGVQGDKGDRGVQGPDGQNGKDGKNGKDGTNGITPDVSAVVDLVLKKIAGGEVIKPEHVKGLPGTLNELITHLKLGGFRGGGDTVAAGTNVTISTVNGVKTISTTGGAGNTFVYNEVLGGSGTAFTFAVAPINGLYTIYGRGQRLIKTTDYSVVGINITTVDTWSASDLTADSQHL